MWLVAPLTKLAAVSLPTLAPSIGNGMTGWRRGQPFCEIVHDKFEEQTKKIDTIDIKAIKQQEVVFLSDASHVAIFFNSFDMTCGSKMRLSNNYVLLICGHWAVPARRIMLFFLQLQATILIIHLFVTTQYNILHIHISVCVLKHISPVLTPKYILSSYTKDRFQALGMGAMKGQKGSPKKAWCHGVSWGRDSCKFRFPSKRSAPKLKAIDGVHFHRNDQKYRKHQPWSSFERVVAEKATSNICE